MWRTLRNELPAGLTTDKDPSTWSGIADTGTNALTSPLLVCGQVCKVRSVALSCMKYVKLGCSKSCKDVLDRANRGSCQSEIIAHFVHVSAYLFKHHHQKMKRAHTGTVSSGERTMQMKRESTRLTILAVLCTPGAQKSTCISITMSAVFSGLRSPSKGHG
jgi:hypothetical protein